MIRCVLGIDPGANGAISFVGLRKPNRLISSYDAKKHTLLDLSDIIKDRKSIIHKAYIERVGSRPGQGVSSTFKFGQNYGQYIGMLTALHIPFEYVSPQVWQKKLSCLSKGDKNVTKQKAQELYPEAKITHSNADAILIGYYGAKER